MLRVRFTSDDLARVRVAPGPDFLWEISNSVQTLQRRDGEREFGARGRWVRPRLSGSPRLLSRLLPPRGYSPETFHIAQLLPWIDANFRTYAEYDGRAVSGFSMGGFGALKYAAKYYGHFASVSAHSGPASLRRDAGLVTHWANVSSAALDPAGGSVYGVPLWDEARVSADNPVQRIESYRDKRVFLVAGTSPDPVNWFDQVNENQVLAGQREFR